MIAYQWGSSGTVKLNMRQRFAHWASGLRITPLPGIDGGQNREMTAGCITGPLVNPMRKVKGQKATMRAPPRESIK